MPVAKKKVRKKKSSTVEDSQRFKPEDVLKAIKTVFCPTGKLSAKFLWRQSNVERWRVNWEHKSAFLAISQSPDGLVVEDRTRRKQ